MMSLKKVPFGEINAVNIIVEVPHGQSKKYEYDPAMEAMRLDGVLYDGVTFPFNYGYVAQTEAQDGDGLDAFVISTHPISSGMVVPSRPIGMLEVIDRGHKDHKIIAVPIHEHRLDYLQDIINLPGAEIKKFEEFYKNLAAQWNRDIKLNGVVGKNLAEKELRLTQNFE